MDCKHEKTDLRFKMFANGEGRHFADQCTICGKQVSEWVKTPPNADSHLPWDVTLAEQGRRDKYTDSQKKHIEEKRKRHHEYDIYINTSPEWKERRALVIDRANQICEACLTYRATQVHHLNYDSFQTEILYDLVAVCRPCHEKIHGIQGGTYDTELKP